MVISLGAPAADGQAAERIQQLKEHVSQNGIDPTLACENGNGALSAAEQESLISLASALFSKAPEDFLQDTEITQMLAIAQRAYNFYRNYQDSDDAFSVEGIFSARDEKGRASSIIMTAIGDRPFVIDTLSELLRKHKIENYVHLHPILQEESGRHTSLVYIQLQQLDDEEKLNSIVSEINRIFSELILVTNDFSAMLVRAETAASTLARVREQNYSSDQDKQEIVQLLRWLADGGFVLFGHNAWEARYHEGRNSELVELEDQRLGLFKSNANETQKQLKNLSGEVRYLADHGETFYFSKINLLSPIHRTARIDFIAVRTLNDDGTVAKIFCFVGLLTSKALSQESSTVPLVRKKLQSILERDGLHPNTHNYKEILSIADSMAKSDLIQLSTKHLRQHLNLVFDIQRRRKVRVTYLLDPLLRFISLSVVIPRERYSTETKEEIRKYLESRFDVPENCSEFHLSVTDYPLAAIRFLIPNPTGTQPSVSIEELEESITELTLRWGDKVCRSLARTMPENKANELFAFYDVAFPEHYKAAATPEETRQDIERLEKISVESPLELSLEEVEEEESDSPLYRLRLYKRGERLTLSAILPFLENVGFDIVNETVTPVAEKGTVWAAIYNLLVRPVSGNRVEQSNANEVLLPGLRMVLLGEASNDPLNTLLLEAGLDYSRIALLRMLTGYLWQIKACTSRTAVIRALVQHGNIAEILVNFFETKFSPSAFPDDVAGVSREGRLESVKNDFLLALKDVSFLGHDRSLRALFNVVEASVRTNYFQHRNSPRISLKIECSKIAFMPSPRPKFEIFVSSPDFDGIHLRGGMVARGGLRWSDRPDDFRTEVLGLMKTQMVKNSIIIPEGAKGGFIVKSRPKDPQELRKRVEFCYRQFIQSLLEITDNRSSEDVIVHPKNTVIYDGDDPYLVVAADRGTATFSDIANEIAQDKFDFWLSDAFASGGSTGYDHKKYGITARGAWEAVTRHFREIGIDVDNQSFSVVGIGDMAGDVFGNGLLLSRNAKLVAAFNHQHIFLDPNPNPEDSFIERERLFNLPRSSWSDYNLECLSQGGGLWERSAKEISLSPQARAALGTERELVSGEELIKILLCAPVDLIWNGGIGTYVRADSETDAEVGDPANDDVRVVARNLRARVIGEGGNLGLTQEARIEYSRIGGHVNTDSVDNSGGVDLSDLEVNLKILFSNPVRRGDISIEKRNQLMLECAEQSCQQVTDRNRSQTLAISLEVRRSRKNIGYYKGLINALEHEGLLDREGEKIPNDETLDKRSAMKAGLTRPELAVLVANSKISLYNSIINSDLPEDPFLQRYLHNYFPEGIASSFKNDIGQHPLRREIIATQVANLVVERMGATFAYRTAEETGAEATDIVLSVVAADEIIEGRTLAKELGIMDKPNATRAHLITLLHLQSALDGMTRWILEHRNASTSVSQLVDQQAEPFRRLVQETGSLIADLERSRFHESCRQLIVSGVPKHLATTVSSVPYAASYMDIVKIAAVTNRDGVEVAALYSQLNQILHIRQLLEHSAEIEPKDHWEALALRSVTVDLRNTVAKLTEQVIRVQNDTSTAAMTSYLEERTTIIERYRKNIHAFDSKALTVAALLVMSKQLSALARSNK